MGVHLGTVSGGDPAYPSKAVRVNTGKRRQL